jgi:NAD(P)-dependent dehydrogenase (short-subunit alcohol dehydrogenase family)
VLTGQSPEHVESAVADVGGAGGHVRGATFDLAQPESIAPALADIGPVRRLALVAIDRDQNSVREYDLVRAIRLVTLKLVGYTEVVHALADRLTDDASIVLFGGMAKERPYPGSTTVTTVNGGVVGLTRTLVEELRPIRVNSLHPGVVGNSPYWAEKPAAIANTRRRRRWVGWRRCTRSSTRRCSCSRTQRSTGSSSSSTAAGTAAERRKADRGLDASKLGSSCPA